MGSLFGDGWFGRRPWRRADVELVRFDPEQHRCHRRRVDGSFPAAMPPAPCSEGCRERGGNANGAQILAFAYPRHERPVRNDAGFRSGQRGRLWNDYRAVVEYHRQKATRSMETSSAKVWTRHQPLTFARYSKDAMSESEIDKRWRAGPDRPDCATPKIWPQIDLCSAFVECASRSRRRARQTTSA